MGGLLVLVGLGLASPERLRLCQGALRAPWARAVFWGGALVWFLIKVLQLGEADYGQYRNLLFALFGTAGVMAFFVVPDFLAVRGLAVLMLLGANVLLDAAFMQEPLSRLFLVSMVYVWIVGALYVGALPFRLRDGLEWLQDRSGWARALGTALGAYGVLLLGASFFI